MHKVSDGQRRRVQICMSLLKEFKVYVAHGKLQLASTMEEVKKMSNLSLMRTVEQWLRKETDEERKIRKEQKANGLLEFDRRVDGTRVTGDPVHVVNNGWAAGRLNSTVVGEENFVYNLNRVIRQ
ncbi:hypothetical protein HanOQP8_Chr01g0025121 [Helianthus annuus]|nr:hypothetical protein HanOQP8_Chr01g0025121 [Helianthus annuus]